MWCQSWAPPPCCDYVAVACAITHPPLLLCALRCAVSALYYMLTAYSRELAGSEEGRRAVLLAADALLVALKVRHFICGVVMYVLCARGCIS